jgi:hypothetical protein
MMVINPCHIYVMFCIPNKTFTFVRKINRYE